MNFSTSSFYHLWFFFLVKLVLYTPLRKSDYLSVHSSHFKWCVSLTFKLNLTLAYITNFYFHLIIIITFIILFITFNSLRQQKQETLEEPRLKKGPLLFGWLHIVQLQIIYFYNYLLYGKKSIIFTIFFNIKSVIYADIRPKPL